MKLTVFDHPLSFADVVFRDTLENLFSCGNCQISLLEQLPFALVRPGKIIAVRCPSCKTAWAFARIPDEFVKECQLKREDVAAIEERLDAYVGSPAPTFPASACPDPALDHAEKDAATHALDADVSGSPDPVVTCTRCGRQLTALDSILRGMGEVCAGKNGNGSKPHTTTPNAMRKLL